MPIAIDTSDPANPRIREVPHIVGLQGIAEGFLYEAKNYLRDLLEIFAIAFGCKLRDASALADLKGEGDSALVKWATATFGQDDSLTQMLRTEQPWVGSLIRMRNAVEHPAGLSGTLIINNIRSRTGERARYIPPTWKITGGPEGPILEEMGIGLDNMLTLGEDLLVETVRHKPVSEHVDFYEIPIEERRPECPTRIQIGPSRDLMAKIAKHLKSPTDKFPSPAMPCLGTPSRGSVTRTHGYAATREDAMAAFAKSWRRE